MTTSNPLTPAAQKVWDAFRPTSHTRIALANTFRAAAPMMQFVQDHERLLAIATEPEGSNARPS